MCGGLKINGKMVISYKECLSVLWYACACVCVCAFDYIWIDVSVYMNRPHCGMARRKIKWTKCWIPSSNVLNCSIGILNTLKHPKKIPCNQNKNPIETHICPLYSQIFNLIPDCSRCNGRFCKKQHLKDSFIPPESFYRTTEQSPKSKTITVVTKEENWMNMNWHRQEQQH